jgi:hypothetical protein
VKKYLFIFLLSGLFYVVHAQTSYYVSPSGLDTNSGDIYNPWKTLNFAIGHLQAGDSLFVMEGTYPGKIEVNVSGAENMPIIITNYLQDEVFISGSNLNAGEYLLKMEEKSHVSISGIKFGNYQALDAQGILIINSSDITISNCEFTNIDYSPTAEGETPIEQQNAQPIIVFGRNVGTPVQQITIQNCQIHDCETGWSEALSLNGNIDGFKLLNNEIYNNTNIGIVAIGFEGECPDSSQDQARNGLIKGNKVYNNPSAYDAAAGIYIDGGKDIIVENNLSYMNDYGIEIGCENNGQVSGEPSASGIIVRNNLIYHNLQSGIVVGGYNYPITGKVKNCLVRNNTLYHNDMTNSYSGEMYFTYVESTYIENNIFYASNADNVLYISEKENSGLAFDYNLYYTTEINEDAIIIENNGAEYTSFSNYVQDTQRDAHSFFSDPMFVDDTQSSLDLHLTEFSPAIDHGNPNTQTDPLETDIDNETRIIHTKIDIGADEFSGTVNVQTSKESGPMIFPNPFNNGIYLDPSYSFKPFIIYSMAGVQILKGYTRESYIDLSILPPGLYLLEITDSKHRNYHLKIIKNSF